MAVIMEFRKDLFFNQYGPVEARLTDYKIFEAKKMVETTNLATLAYHIIYGLEYDELMMQFLNTLNDDKSFADEMTKAYFKLRYFRLPRTSDACYRINATIKSGFVTFVG
jgi:hypothetical protein